MRNLLLFTGGLLPILGADSVLASSQAARHKRDSAFDPLAFHQQVVTCPGINRAQNKTIDLQLRTLPKSH
jgi:hypothetical protein